MRSRERGLSIIELMIGMAVALLVSLAAASSAIVFTAAQRQGIGTSGANMNTLNALSTIKTEVALGGLGFFGDSRYRCGTLALSTGATVRSNSAVFTPVSITRDAGTGDDRIDVVYGDQIEAGAEVLVSQAPTATEARLRSLLPVTVGEAVVIASAAGTQPCIVRTVTANTASTASTPQTLTFANTGLHNGAAFATTPTFATDDRVTLLGTLNWMRFRRVGNTLVAESVLTGTQAVIGRDVIGLRAEYGVAPTVTDSALSAWEPAAAGSAFASLDGSELRRVRAVRVGVVTRSPQREKPDAAGNCQASLSMPQVFGQTVTPDGTDWQCYRYGVASTVIPLRNLVMGY
jgi:type IV pilus assembly protein PilW